LTGADLKELLLRAVGPEATAGEVERVISCLRGLEVPKVVREWLTEELHLARVSVPAAPKHEALRALVLENKGRLRDRAQVLRGKVMTEWRPEGQVSEIHV
jgi:ornithine cyclodeaminase/alanine dehydrogenase-like protein (mu-crystallin family)